MERGIYRPGVDLVSVFVYLFYIRRSKRFIIDVEIKAVFVEDFKYIPAVMLRKKLNGLIGKQSANIDAVLKIKGDKNDLITERKQPALRSEISGTALH